MTKMQLLGRAISGMLPLSLIYVGENIGAIIITLFLIWFKIPDIYDLMERKNEE